MFAFDLALALGECNPDAMLSRIPLAIFYDWMDYAKRKPFGDERADLRIALMASAFVNTQIAKGPRTRPLDFMPFSKEGGTKPKQTPTQMRALLKGMSRLRRRESEDIANANRS